MRTSRASAPMARRMPISRVRSVTDTSMMFMMPTPPTARLIPAIAATATVSVPTAVLTASFTCAESMMLKSFCSPGCSSRRSRKRSIRDCWIELLL